MNIDDLNQPKIIDEPVKIYEPVDIQVQPDFPGGINNLYKFLKNNIKYPENESANEIDGTVYVQFIVGKDGNIREVSIARPVSSGLDEEAVRVVKAMPAWNPGKQNGMPVAVKFMLPIKFKMMNQ